LELFSESWPTERKDIFLGSKNKVYLFTTNVASLIGKANELISKFMSFLVGDGHHENQNK